MLARKMTFSTFKHTSLNPPPDVERETIEQDYDGCSWNSHQETAAYPFLIDHLQALAMINYINMTAENENLRRDYNSIYKIPRAAIAADVAKDARPFRHGAFRYPQTKFRHCPSCGWDPGNQTSFIL